MAINPNIALGVQPIQQQPNMLAQYAQVMAIKAAQQEMEGNEGFKSALVGGMDPTDPRILQYGKPGRETFKAAGEGRIKQLEAASKSNEILGGIFGGVMQDPSTGPQAVSRLVEMGVMTRDQAQKVIADAGNNPDAWRSLAKPYYEGAISAAQRLTAETSRYSTNVAAGTAANRLKFDTENRDYDRANPTLQRAEGENGFYLYDPRKPNSAVPLGMAPSAPPPPVTQPSAVNNMLITPGVAQPSVNALTQPAPNQAGPTVAAANALNQQPTIIRPKQPLRQPSLVRVNDPATPGQKLEVDANVYKQGTTLGAPGVIGVASTETLNPAQKQKLKAEISKDYEALQRVVGQTNELLESIDAVKNSNLESVTGQFDARTPSFGKEAQIAETRFNNLKGKVTAIAKANASLGGAIGSIANQEWQILANQIAVLERTAGKTANLEQIDQLERQAMSIVSRMQDGFQRQYGGDVETLAPQYKEVPNVNYTPGQYTATGKKTSSVDSTNPWLK